MPEDWLFFWSEASSTERLPTRLRQVLRASTRGRQSSGNKPLSACCPVQWFLQFVKDSSCGSSNAVAGSLEVIRSSRAARVAFFAIPFASLVARDNAVDLLRRLFLPSDVIDGTKEQYTIVPLVLGWLPGGSTGTSSADWEQEGVLCALAMHAHAVHDRAARALPAPVRRHQRRPHWWQRRRR